MLPFGLNCSSFLLRGTLEHMVSGVIQNNVDDLNSGSSNVTEGYELFEKTKSIMLKAGMNMRKWRTNSQELIKMIEANKTVVSPEPVSVTDDPMCDSKHCCSQFSYSK